MANMGLEQYPAWLHEGSRLPLGYSGLEVFSESQLFSHSQIDVVHIFPRNLLRANNLPDRHRDRPQVSSRDKRKKLMAPGYRANNQSRRTNRSYVDHDVFEGLPVRNWRREAVNVAPPPVHEVSIQKDVWDVELPWGMPKDSHLLPQHSQELLRAARSGRLYVRRRAIEEEEVDPEAAVGDKPEKKQQDPKEKGFAVKTWKQVPRHLEGPEIEYLAKRRKGLTGTTIKTTAVPAPIARPTMTKATVRRTDAEGNTYVEDVVVAEGQAVEGELISQTAIVNPIFPATDGAPLLPPPPRRRPPPPKRKAKGPGRGRKRKLPLAPTSVPAEIGAVKTEPDNKEAGALQEVVGPGGIKLETPTSTSNDNDNEDADMGDDSILPSDEEDEDGSDDEEEGDDQGDGQGDDQGDQDDDDIDQTTSTLIEPTQQHITSSIDRLDHNTNITERRTDKSSPEYPLATVISTIGQEHGSAGSPLKNVMTFPPTIYEEHSPEISSDGEAEAEGDLDEVVHENIHEEIQDGAEEDVVHNPYHMPQDMGMGMQPHSSISYELHGPVEGDMEGDMSMEQSRDYADDDADDDDDDDEMLLDGDVSGMEFQDMSTDGYPEPFLDDDEEVMPIPVQDSMPPFDTQLQQQDFDSLEEHDMGPPPSMGPEGEEVDEEDGNFEDLLGSLEDHLNDQDQDAALGSEELHVTQDADGDSSGKAQKDALATLNAVPLPAIAEVAAEAETQANIEAEQAASDLKTEPEPEPVPVDEDVVDEEQVEQVEQVADETTKHVGG